MPVVLGEPLSIDEVAAAARGEPVEVSAAARKRMDASRRVVEETIAAGATVYGVTTGLGSLALRARESRRERAGWRRKGRSFTEDNFNHQDTKSTKRGIGFRL